MQVVENAFPQGLKPPFIWGSIGTTKVVPCYKTHHRAVAENASQAFFRSL
jgi:hypothetical protein